MSHRSHALTKCLFALLLLLPWSGRAPASRVEDLLDRADSVRTTDPKAFADVLGQLELLRPEATAAQMRRLRLLGAYQKALGGRYDEAILDAVALFEQATEPEIRFRAALLVANTAAVTRDFVLGLRYLERALDLQDSVRDTETKHFGFGVAAILYNQYGQYELSRHYAERLLAARTTGRTRCVAHLVQVEALQGLGERVDPTRAIQPAIDVCLAQKEPIASNLLRTFIAREWAADGRLRDAIALLERHLPEAEATGYARLIAEVRGLLAQYYLELGEVMQAEVHAQAVQKLDASAPNGLPKVTAHRVLYEAALQRGNLGAALRQYRMYADAEKAQLDEVKAREYAFQLSRHEIRQKNQSIELLSNQNQLLRLQQDLAQRSAWNFRLAFALLAVLAASLAYWVWRARSTHRSLRQLAETDGLTGLFNRRHYRSRSEAVLAAASTRQRPISLLLLDLDHFKQINDQCGHSAGDWVLREVARVGRVQCRDGDLYGRIGGEEFAVTLIDCDIDDAMRIAEGFRRAVASIDALATGCPLPISASIGVVGTSQSGYDYESLMAHADAAMYRSKVAGRNRVTLYEAPPLSPTRGTVALEGRNAEAMLREY
ncbi:sensor domain-containing diguanylate cyclase [Lysobacter humi (ex Lee et al. 2017)]